MKMPPLSLFGFSLAALCTAQVVAQEPAPPSPSQAAARPRTVQVNQTTQKAAPRIPLLSRNYDLKFKVAEGENITEYNLVNAAKEISVYLSAAPDGQRPLSVNGMLEELEDESVGISFVISQSLPTPTAPQAGVPQPGPRQDQKESFSVSLRMKPGVEHSLVTTAARTYRLTITPLDETATGQVQVDAKRGQVVPERINQSVQPSTPPVGQSPAAPPQASPPTAANVVKEGLEYRAVSASNDGELSARVTALLAEGWRPHGGVSVASENARTTLAQGLVRRTYTPQSKTD